MKAVTGFLTGDGRFHENAEDAEYHEAAIVLENVFRQIAPDGRFNKFITSLLSMQPDIERFFDAYKAKEARDQAALDRFQYNAADPAPASQDQADAGLGTNDETYVEQSFRGLDDMPDLGARSLEETLRGSGEGDGFGMRRGDAQGVRGSQDMAVNEVAEDATARGRDGGTPVRL